MSLDTAKKLIDLILEPNDKNQYITYENTKGIVLDFIGGEPLLQSKLINDIIDYFQYRTLILDSPYKDNNAYILGAYGSWLISGFELETSLGYANYSKNDDEYSVGVSIYRKGWTLGGSFRKTKAKSTPIYAYNLYDGYRDSKAYNIGLSYEIGPFTTGVSYFNSKSDKFNNEDDIYSFSNSYEYNKSTTFSLTVANLNSKAQTTTKGYAFVLGMELML